MPQPPTSTRFAVLDYWAACWAGGCWPAACWLLRSGCMCCCCCCCCLLPAAAAACAACAACAAAAAADLRGAQQCDPHPSRSARSWTAPAGPRSTWPRSTATPPPQLSWFALHPPRPARCSASFCPPSPACLPPVVPHPACTGRHRRPRRPACCRVSCLQSRLLQPFPPRAMVAPGPRAPPPDSR